MKTTSAPVDVSQPSSSIPLITAPAGRNTGASTSCPVGLNLLYGPVSSWIEPSMELKANAGTVNTDVYAVPHAGEPASRGVTSDSGPASVALSCA